MNAKAAPTLSEEDLAEIWTGLLYWFDQDVEHAAEWMLKPHPVFGVRPCDSIKMGHGHRVLSFVRNTLVGAFQ